MKFNKDITALLIHSFVGSTDGYDGRRDSISGELNSLLTLGGFTKFS